MDVENKNNLKMAVYDANDPLLIDGDFAGLASAARTAIGWDNYADRNYGELSRTLMIDHRVFVQLLKGHAPSERILTQFAHETEADAVLLRSLAFYSLAVRPNPRELAGGRSNTATSATRIRNAREAIGMFRKDLADALGLDESVLKVIESGKRPHDISTPKLIVEIAAKLGCEPLSLIDVTEHDLRSAMVRIVQESGE